MKELTDDLLVTVRYNSCQNYNEDEGVIVEHRCWDDGTTR